MTEVATISIFDNFLPNADQHLNNVLSGDFFNFNDGANVFKNVQLRSGDDVEQRVIQIFGHNYDCALNFARKSPEGQEEPNRIHHDTNMGDLICLLYLNKEHPEEAGTSVFEANGSIAHKVGETPSKGFKKSLDFKMKFNRMIVFPARFYHGRNIEENFGEGENSRLVQVLFLTQKSK